MKRIILLAALLGATLTANASCFGSGSMQTCTDSSGNSYNVQRYGNTTSVQGYNANTGSTWSQTSNTYGNTTSTYGSAANGNTWNSTTYSTPGMTQQYGTDSNGRSFQRTCTQYGCN
jgi:hypothetical protein